MATHKKAGGSNTGSNVHLVDLTDNTQNAEKDTTLPTKDGKLKTMLRRFAMGARLHRFEAELLGDHVLPTTISTLQRQYDIIFNRNWVKVPNRFGSETSVKEYWLDGEERIKAQIILQSGGGPCFHAKN